MHFRPCGRGYDMYECKCYSNKWPSLKRPMGIHGDFAVITPMEMQNGCRAGMGASIGVGTDAVFAEAVKQLKDRYGVQWSDLPQKTQVNEIYSEMRRIDLEVLNASPEHAGANPPLQGDHITGR